MATTPKGLTQDEDGNYELPPGHTLPGHTVDALLAEGKIDEARQELEKLLIAGRDSAPGRPMYEILYKELVSNIRSRVAAVKP